MFAPVFAAMFAPVNVYPGQKVITSAGVAAVVAFVAPNGTVYATGARDRVPRAVIVRCDAWGGEHDLAAGLPAPMPVAEPSPRGPRRRGHTARVPALRLRLAA